MFLSLSNFSETCNFLEKSQNLDDNLQPRDYYVNWIVDWATEKWYVAQRITAFVVAANGF